MKAFRNYLISEARWDVLQNIDIPIPQQAINVVNVVGCITKGKITDASFRSIKSQVLEWIFKEGLRQASLKRREFARQLSKQVGREVHQDEVFSTEARLKDPNLPSIKETDALWLDGGYEPDEITIVYNNEAGTLSLSEINKALEGIGKKPFRFGTSKGFIEFLETGELNPGDSGPKRYWQGDRTTIAKFGRHGVDVSIDPDSDGTWVDNKGQRSIRLGAFERDAEGNILTDPDDPNSGQEGGGYLPPMGAEQYGRLIDRYSAHYSRSILNMSQALKQTPEGQEAIKGAEGLTVGHEPGTAADTFGIMARSSTKDVSHISDPEEYQLLKRAIESELKVLLDRPRAEGRGKKGAGNGLKPSADPTDPHGRRMRDRAGRPIFAKIPGGFKRGRKKGEIASKEVVLSGEPQDRAKDLQALLNYICIDNPDGTGDIRHRYPILWSDMDPKMAYRVDVRHLINPGIKRLQQQGEEFERDIPYHAGQHLYAPNNNFVPGNLVDIEDMIRDGLVPVGVDPKKTSIDGMVKMAMDGRTSMTMQYPGTRKSYVLIKDPQSGKWHIAKSSGKGTLLQQPNKYQMGITPEVQPKIRVNSAASGMVSHISRADLRKAEAQGALNFRDNPEDYGDELVDWGGNKVLKSVRDALGTFKGQDEEFMGLVWYTLLKSATKPVFKFGQLQGDFRGCLPNTIEKINAGKTRLKLKAPLTPENIAYIFAVAPKIYENPAYEDPEAPGASRVVYKILLQNGYNWRQKTINNTLNNEESKKIRRNWGTFSGNKTTGDDGPEIQAGFDVAQGRAHAGLRTSMGDEGRSVNKKRLLPMRDFGLTPEEERDNFEKKIEAKTLGNPAIYARLQTNHDLVCSHNYFYNYTSPEPKTQNIIEQPYLAEIKKDPKNARARSSEIFSGIVNSLIVSVEATYRSRKFVQALAEIDSVVDALSYMNQKGAPGVFDKEISDPTIWAKMSTLDKLASSQIGSPPLPWAEMMTRVGKFPSQAKIGSLPDYAPELGEEDFWGSGWGEEAPVKQKKPRKKKEKKAEEEGWGSLDAWDAVDQPEQPARPKPKPKPKLAPIQTKAPEEEWGSLDAWDAVDQPDQPAPARPAAAPTPTQPIPDEGWGSLDAWDAVDQEPTSPVVPSPQVHKQQFNTMKTQAIQQTQIRKAESYSIEDTWVDLWGDP